MHKTATTQEVKALQAKSLKVAIIISCDIRIKLQIFPRSCNKFMLQYLNKAEENFLTNSIKIKSAVKNKIPLPWL